MPSSFDLNQLDQPAWQKLTTWEGDPPGHGDVWKLLTSDALPTRFQETLRLSNHAFLQRLRRGTSVGLSAGTALDPQKRWNNRFANLVSGRFTEILFSRAYRSAIEAEGLELVPTMDRRDWLDYMIRGDGDAFRLAINLKNAGVQFRQAQTFVGMPPEDTLPIATYKIFGSSSKEEQVPLVYVYLVDWTLIARLRPAYWLALNPVERQFFKMVTTFKGIPRDLEDSFIEATVGDRLEALSAGVGYDVRALAELPFRAISGARCKAIFYRNHERSPYVFLQRMDTDPNVHVSVQHETVQFGSFLEAWLTSLARRKQLLAGLRHTISMDVPDPPV